MYASNHAAMNTRALCRTCQQNLKFQRAGVSSDKDLHTSSVDTIPSNALLQARTNTADDILHCHRPCNQRLTSPFPLLTATTKARPPKVMRATDSFRLTGGSAQCCGVVAWCPTEASSDSRPPGNTSGRPAGNESRVCKHKIERDKFSAISRCIENRGLWKILEL